MSSAIEARGRAAGEAAAARVAERLAERVRAELPGVAVEIEPSGISLAGRGLRRRMLAEPLLRWIGELLR